MPVDPLGRALIALHTAENAMDSIDRKVVSTAHQALGIAAEKLAKAVYEVARQDSATIIPNFDAPPSLPPAAPSTLSIEDELVDDEK